MKEKLKISLHTYKNIGDASYANSILEALQRAGISFSKMDIYEPLKQVYNKDEFLRIWTTSAEDVFDNNTCRFSAVLCSAKPCQGSFSAMFRKRINQANAQAELYLYINYNWGNRHKQAIINLLKELILLLEPAAAQISNRRTFLSTHGFRDDPYKYLKDAQWITFYTQEMIRQIGEQLFYQAPWVKVEEIAGGVLAYISENAPLSGGEEEAVCRKVRDMFWPEYSHCETQEYAVEREERIRGPLPRPLKK